MDSEIQSLRKFLQEHMATKEDIAEIKEDVAEINDKIDTMQESISTLHNAVDSFAKSYNDDDQEKAATSNQLARIEDWIKKAADKIGVAYKP